MYVCFMDISKQGYVAAVRVTVDRVLDICVAGGAEILGLHATVAPRRQQTQLPPTLEKFSFIPNIEEDLCAKNQALREYLEKSLAYIKSSIASLLDNGIASTLPNVELFKSLASKAKKVSEEELNEVAAQPRTGLVKTLQAVYSQEQNSQFVEGARQEIAARVKDVNEDQLTGFLLCEGPLKNCCDIVLENSIQTKMKIVELSASSNRIYEQLIRQLNTQPMLKINYTLTGKDVQADEAMEGLDVAAAGWEPGSEPPNTLLSSDLVTLSNTLNKYADPVQALKDIKALLKDDGFLLILEPTQNFELTLGLDGLQQDFTKLPTRSLGPYLKEAGWLKIIQDAGLEVISKKSDGLLNTLFLCRKIIEEEQSPVLFEVDDLQFGWIEKLKTALAEIDEKPKNCKLWLVSNQPLNGIIGMVNCLRQETGGDHVRCVFNASLDSSKAPAITLDSPVFKQLLGKDLVMNIYRHGVWGSMRHNEIKKTVTRVETPHAYVNVLTRGDLSSLQWIESPLKYFKQEQNPDKDLCSVYYTSLNFRDVMLATGKLPPDAIPGDIANQDCILGMEFSGRSSKGQRVMGLLPAKVTSIF